MQTDIQSRHHQLSSFALTNHLGYIVPTLIYALCAEWFSSTITPMMFVPFCVIVALVQHRQMGTKYQQYQLYGLSLGLLLFTGTIVFSKNETASVLAFVGIFGSIVALFTWIIRVRETLNDSEMWFYRRKGYLTDKMYTSSTIFRLPIYLMSLFVGSLVAICKPLQRLAQIVEQSAPTNWWKTIIQPIVFIGIFMCLYSLTSSKFAASVEMLFFPIFLLKDGYEYITLHTNIVGFLKTVGCISIGFLPFSKLGSHWILNNPLFNGREDSNSMEDIEPPQYNEDVKSLGLETHALDSNACEHNPETNDAVTKLDETHSLHELSTMTPTLIALNMLLIWFHVVDLYSLTTLDWSDAPTWSKAVHESMSGAVLGTISGLLLLNIKSIDWRNSENVLWGKIWAYNNAFFAGMTLLKCSVYLFSFGFTEARMLVIALMIGILGSFFIGIKKLTTQRDGLWFLSRITEAQYACFVIATIIISLTTT